MFRTLIRRNARRSFKDYLIYIATMTIISTLMFSFHGMIFSKDMRRLFREMGIFAVLIGMASFFIIGIVIWLVNYIVTFMMEKRSKEFGTYLLLGMTKKQIITLFRRENYLLGMIATLLGILPGYLFQLLFIKIFFWVLEMDYRITPDVNLLYLLVTFGVLGVAYVIALGSIKRKMKWMTIRDFVSFDQKNEAIVHEKSARKGIFVFLSIGYILFFNFMVMAVGMSLIVAIVLTMLLIVAIYLLYIGLSAFFVQFIQRKSPLIYQKEALFVLRQLSSKIKTMRFTLGTLTVLFTGALFSWMVVMMFADFQQTQIKQELPFDAIMASPKKKDTFEKELATISAEAPIKRNLHYTIYQNQTNAMNEFLYKHVDGTSRGKKIKKRWTHGTYFGQDTYMKLSDYNQLRKMLGYDAVSVKQGHYILHGKKRLEKQWQEVGKAVPIKAAGKKLHLQETHMEPFSQNGLNGADYLLVVSDEVAAQLNPYYSLLAVDLEKTAPSGLQEKLDKQDKNFVEDEEEGDLYKIQYGIGSNQIIAATGTVLVRDNLYKEASFVVISICFMMAYLGVVFLCAALTILAIQQLSDSSKHKKRYEILQQLGVNKQEIHRIVLKQLSMYYLCPLCVSVVLSLFIGMFAGERFVYYTGVQGTPVKFYGAALLLFLVIYLGYFIATYVGFTRNLEK